MPYGAQPEGSGRAHAIGSLDLLSADPVLPLFGTGATQVRGAGGDREQLRDVDAPDGRFDLVIMNPPFTRPTNHESTTVPVPSFAGFGTSNEEQKVMARRLSEYRRALDMPAGHGNAGLASNFIDLADAKLRNGGVAAFVLPAAFVQGDSWRNARRLFEIRYRDLELVSITDVGSTNRAFSADTGMAEVLIVATKRELRSEASRPRSPSPRNSPGNAVFLNLHNRPRSILEAVALARSARALQQPSGAIGRSGRIPLTANEDGGTFVRAGLQNGGAAGIRNRSIADTMLDLPEGRLRLPRRTDARCVGVVALGEIGHAGLYHPDLRGGPQHKGGPPRGPFDILQLDDAEVPLYPTLWGHDAKRERRLVVGPDRRAEARPGCGKRAVAVWQKHATKPHFNLDFRINSQPLAACLTPEKALGGRAWPNFKPHDERWETPVVLWSNTTLGLMSFWWLGARQQQGRAILTLSTLPDLPVLDPRRLTDSQHAAAEHLLADFREREFLPANEAYRDETRQALDRAVLVDLLGLPDDAMEPLDLLRRQWCAEPTVHGGKSTRPRTGEP